MTRWPFDGDGVTDQESDNTPAGAGPVLLGEPDSWSPDISCRGRIRWKRGERPVVQCQSTADAAGTARRAPPRVTSSAVSPRPDAHTVVGQRCRRQYTRATAA